MDKVFYVENGDLRMDYCRRYLIDNGYNVTDSVDKCDFVILPFNVNDFDKYNGKTVFSYNKTENTISYCTDEFVKENSVLTAQGTLAVTLENCKRNIGEMKIAVLGYGNCGKEICRVFKNICCNVSCFARRKEVRKQICSDGFSLIEDINSNLCDYDIIINTVPCNIIPEVQLELLSENNMYIEIASAPYGFDKSKIDRYKFKFIPASGLPGKYTPISAGENIAKAVIGIIKVTADLISGY